jgi:hypothetical protein
MPENDPRDLIRVKDKDLNRNVTITRGELPHGNYQELKQPAVDAAGNRLPPEFLDDADSAASATSKSKES